MDTVEVRNAHFALRGRGGADRLRTFVGIPSQEHVGWSRLPGKMLDFCEILNVFGKSMDTQEVEMLILLSGGREGAGGLRTFARIPSQRHVGWSRLPGKMLDFF